MICVVGSFRLRKVNAENNRRRYEPNKKDPFAFRMRDPWLWYQLFKAVDIKKNKQHGGSNPKDLEKQVRKDSGLSKREMGELKRMIKKDRRRFVGLSDEQIVSEVRLSYKKRQRTITWIAVILLIAVIVYALTNSI